MMDSTGPWSDGYREHREEPEEPDDVDPSAATPLLTTENEVDPSIKDRKARRQHSIAYQIGEYCLSLINAMTGSSKDIAKSSEHENVPPANPDAWVDSVSYGPGGMRGLFSNSYVFGAAFLASLGGFSFGYDQGVISIINVMDNFHRAFPEAATAFGTSFMTSMLLLGAFIGCFFMPYLCDKISRKWALTVVVVIFDIGAIMQTAAQSYGELVAGRAIGGIGVGTLAMVCWLFPILSFFLSGCSMIDKDSR